MRWVLGHIFLLSAVLLLTACGSGGRSAAGCGAPHHDPFDPRSVTHILPGATPPRYLTDPPTSGEHQPVNLTLYRGVHPTPVPPQIQVALLESSLVVVQYRPPASLTQLAPLEQLPLVTIAPNPTLPAPVVATAWLWRLQCTSPNIAALRAFAVDHQGNGPQSPPAKPS